MVAALIVFGISAEIIGEERKARWFHKRTKFSWFVRRGIMGEKFHFGYPCTIEGVLVFIVMIAIISALTLFIFTTPLLN